jgi:hypothetical protein
MTLDDAVALEPVPNRVYLDIQAMCESVGGPIADALNRLALDLAQRYFDGRVTYSVADAVINNMHAYCTRNIASLPGRTTPEPFFTVFLAFDAGEFYPDEIRDPSPEERFTRPQIAAILSKYQIDQSGHFR